MYICICVYMYICMCVYMYIRMCVYIQVKVSIARASSLFILYIAVIAEHFRQQTRRQTIVADDIIQAQKRAGFSEFIPALNIYLQRIRDLALQKRLKHPKKKYGSYKITTAATEAANEAFARLTSLPPTTHSSETINKRTIYETLDSESKVPIDSEKISEHLDSQSPSKIQRLENDTGTDGQSDTQEYISISHAINDEKDLMSDINGEKT